MRHYESHLPRVRIRHPNSSAPERSGTLELNYYFVFLTFTRPTLKNTKTDRYVHLPLLHFLLQHNDAVEEEHAKPFALQVVGGFVEGLLVG